MEEKELEKLRYPIGRFKYNSEAPVSEIKKLLVKKGMATLYQSGIIEVVLGATTFEEVKKVVEADE